MLYPESQFPVANVTEQGIVSAERDGYFVPGQRPMRSHSLAQSGAAGQVNDPRQIATAQRANRSVHVVRSSTERPARWASTGLGWVRIPGPTLIALAQAIGTVGPLARSRSRVFLNLPEEDGERQGNDENLPSAIPVAGANEHGGLTPNPLTCAKRRLAAFTPCMTPPSGFNTTGPTSTLRPLIRWSGVE